VTISFWPGGCQLCAAASARKAHRSNPRDGLAAGPGSGRRRAAPGRREDRSELGTATHTLARSGGGRVARARALPWSSRHTRQRALSYGSCASDLRRRPIELNCRRASVWAAVKPACKSARIAKRSAAGRTVLEASGAGPCSVFEPDRGASIRTPLRWSWPGRSLVLDCRTGRAAWRDVA